MPSSGIGTFPASRRPRNAPGTYLCHTARPSLPDFLPTIWLSDTDQTSEADDIHCELVAGGYSSAARKILKLLAGGFP